MTTPTPDRVTPDASVLSSRPRRYRRGPGVVVSVRLDRDEWEAVSLAAERAGLYVSQFIREGAVRLAKGEK